MPSWKKIIASGSDASFSSATVDTYVSASSFKGSFTGSLFGTASQALTASYLVGAAAAIGFPYTGSAKITGSLEVTGSLNVSGTISAQLANVSQPNFVAYNTATGLFTYANTGSFTATSASYSATASYLNPLRQIVTLTGSLNVSGSTTQIGTNTLLGNTLLSGSVIISGALGQPNPTLSIFGDLNQTGYTRYLPVVTNLDTSISASYIYVSGSTNDLYFSQNGSGYANSTRLRWFEGNLYTGLLSGGVLSSTPGSTTFNLSSGSGIIVALNASTGSTDPFPTIQYVKWAQQLNNPITYSGSAKITYVGVNSSGTIVQQTVPWGSTDVTQWDTQIELGTVLHLSGSVSTGVYNAPQTAYGFAQRTDDFIRAFGPVKISGHTLQASGSSLGLIKTGGTAYNDGANYTNNPNHPSTVNDPAINTSKIYRYYVSGSTPVIDTGVANAGYTFIDPTLYNNNGVLTTVPGSGANKQWSIQRVFWIPNSPTNAFLVYYGNASYATSIDAQNGIQTEVFTEAPNTAQNAILIGYIIVRKDSTNLSDGTTAYITQGGLFRSVSGIGNSNTPSISNTLAGLSDVSISGPTQGDLLVYGGAQWNNLRSLTGPYSITGSLSFLNGGVTASLFGTASQALTASYLLGYTSGFPYSGSAQITGSLGVTGSLNVSGTISAQLANASQPNFVAYNTTTGLFTYANTGSFTATSASYSATASYVNPLRQTVIISGSLIVSASTSTLSIQGSGSNVFSVDGTSGRLFQVDDSLSGSLFSVNTAAGLPVIEAFSDNTVRIGQFGQKALFVSQSRVGVGTEIPTANLDVSGSGRFTNGLSLTGSVQITGSLGVTGSIYISGSLLLNQNTSSLGISTQTVSTNATSSYTSVFYNYTLASGSNARAGQMIAVWSGSAIQYMDNSTTDIGNTSLVALTASLSSGNVLLTTVLPTAGWTVKTLVNLL